VFTKIRFDFATLSEPKTVYDLIKSGVQLTTLAIPSSNNYTVTLTGLVQDVQNAIMSSYKIIGLATYNSNESGSGGTSFSPPAFTVNYTIPTPPKPTNLAVSSPTTSSFVLTWTASTGNVTGYKVYVNGTVITTSATSLTISGLCPGTSYPVYIIPYNPYGNGEKSATVTGTTIATTLSGPDFLCTNGSYTVNNLPAGATITWTNSSNMTMSSPQGSNPCVFAKYSNGNGTINAAISGSCNLNLSIAVHTGPYSSSDYPISGPSSASCRQYVYYNIPTLSGVTSINWTWPSGWTYVSGQNSAYLTLRTGTTGGPVMVGVNNVCGQSGSYAMKYTTVYGSCGYSMSISPNPALNTVNVTITEEVIAQSTSSETSTTDLAANKPFSDKPVSYKVSIMDKMGVTYFNTTKSSKSFTLPVQNLRNGNYIIVVSDGTNTITSQLMVSH
jgi:hypothetical protein